MDKLWFRGLYDCLWRGMVECAQVSCIVDRYSTKGYTAICRYDLESRITKLLWAYISCLFAHASLFTPKQALGKGMGSYQQRRRKPVLSSCFRCSQPNDCHKQFVSCGSVELCLRLPGSLSRGVRTATSCHLRLHQSWRDTQRHHDGDSRDAFFLNWCAC